MKLAVGMALSAAMLLLQVGTAGAWDPLDSCGGGVYTHWEGTPDTTWRYAANYPSGDFSEAESLQIISDSFEEWGEPGCSDFSVSQGPDTSGDPMDWGAADGVGFYESYWPPSLGSGVLAVTFPSWNWDCTMSFASMVVNGYSWTWVAGDWGNDLQSVVTHEAGHWVGLDHSASGDSTMYWSYNGGTGDRVLSCDDTAAACALYPSGGTACGAPGNSEYCPCGQSCVGGWCNGVESGDPWGSGDDDDAVPGDDDDDAGPGDDDDTPVPPSGCMGPPESYVESEPNDWDGDSDYDLFAGSGGDLTVDSWISCGNNGNSWTSDVDWFVVDFPCSDPARFTVDWSGGTSDLDYWVYDANTDLLTNNMDEDYSGPVTEQAYASTRVYIAVACWSGPDVPFTVEVDFEPWGYTPPAGDDDDDDDDDTPGPSDDDDGTPAEGDDDDAVGDDDDDDTGLEDDTGSGDDDGSDDLELLAPEQDFKSIGCSCDTPGAARAPGWLALFVLAGAVRGRRRLLLSRSGR